MASGPDDPPLLVYDGGCGFCTASAAWIVRRWPDGAAHAVAAQSLGPTGLAELGLTPDQAENAAWWVDPQGHLWRGHLAVARSLVAAGGTWGMLGRLLLVPPFRWGAWASYHLVARNRHRLPGPSAACRARRGR